MNVASLELCKELYELSGWTGTHAVWHDDTTLSPLACEYEDITVAIHFTPAYDLGYLLRKLPKVLDNLALTLYWSADEYWIVTYGGTKAIAGKPARKSRKSPEDAACKLAIELFKLGLLNKESHE